jgi:hypothetical protein
MWTSLLPHRAFNNVIEGVESAEIATSPATMGRHNNLNIVDDHDHHNSGRGSALPAIFIAHGRLFAHGALMSLNENVVIAISGSDDAPFLRGRLKSRCR